MKILVAVNEFEHATQLCDYIARFKFPDAELHLVHVCVPIATTAWGLGMDAVSPIDVVEADRVAEVGARSKLDEIAVALSSKGTPVVTRVLSGAPVAQILNYAKETRAALIAVERSERSSLDRLFIGSVSRGLVNNSPTSVLIVSRSHANASGAFTAVLASDHSAYCKKCIEHFRELSPKGLTRLTVLSIYPQNDLTRLRWALPENAAEFEQFVMEKVSRATVDAAEDLKGLAYVVLPKTVVGSAITDIRDTMRSTDAELLIVGAQGHGWLERSSMGSVSFHHAFSEPYSVLILRS